MLIGAALMVGLQVIGIQDALKSINLDVIAFLFGMFSIVSGLDKSGVLKFIALKLISKAKGSTDSILFIFIVGMGILSAFLVNDTIALLGVPLIVQISRHSLFKSPRVLFLALAYGVSVGSVMTPIGNPQNLLIAIQSGIHLPFITFLKVLGIPTLINLFVDYFLLKFLCRKDLLLLAPTRTSSSKQTQGEQQRYSDSTINNNNNNAIVGRGHNSKNKPFIINNNANNPTNTNDNIDDEISSASIVNDPTLAKMSSIIILLTISGFIISEVVSYFYNIRSLSISIIAMFGATALYAFSKERREILYSVNYSVLVFFAAMFVFTYGLWSSGVIPGIITYFQAPNPNNIIQSNAIISTVSIIFSQILSNVPFVSLYDNVMIHSGITGSHISQWMMLAAASTIAGNLTIFGAASNIIIIEAAESRKVKAFSYIEFLKIGVVITIINLCVYYVFLLLTT
jgi:Na+/H+ antiporter NhaD/arsenite permease-like protein